MKNSLLRDRKLLVVIGLVALLPILATLQFRWIGQISVGEVERMRENLDRSAHHFDHAVNDEIFPAQYAFRVSFTQSLEDIARELRRNYQYWTSRVEHPDLIEAIYWVDFDAQKQLRLHAFDPASGSLVQQPWPSDLEGWNSYFLKRSRLLLEQYNLQAQPDTGGVDRSSELAELIALLQAERPAIPIPVSIDEELPPEDLLANLNATSSGLAGHTLLVLNRDYLNQTFFPNLYREYFAIDEQNIELRIVSLIDPNRVVYQSDPALSAIHFEEADISKDIGRLRWSGFTPAYSIAFRYATLVDRSPSIADSLLNRAQRAWMPAIRDSFIAETHHDSDFPLHAIIHLAQEEDFKGDLTAEDLLVALTSLQERPDFTPVPPPDASTQAGPDHAWTLLVRHNTGSLQAAVQANRWRNLILSFGILSILGIAIVMIYSSSRKSQRLAKRQIDFVTGVSHELRTPLAVIRSAAENLADGVVVDAGKTQKYGYLIGREGRRLSDMVEQILELAGLQSGKKAFDFQSVQVANLVNEALNSWRDTIDEKNFEVVASIEENLPALRADSKSLQVVLSNLINNALKYHNGRRWIGVKAALAENGSGQEVQISVSDRGPGIPAEELPYIFDEFYRGRDTQRTQIRGNGIGLSIVKKTVEAHGGRVTVRTQPQQGSTFTLHLPVLE